MSDTPTSERKFNGTTSAGHSIRVEVDDIPLTQQFVAMMLGTGRSGVMLAAATFQNADFIEYTRDPIHIINRAGLEAATCNCYKIARQPIRWRCAELAAPGLNAK